MYFSKGMSPAWHHMVVLRIKDVTHKTVISVILIYTGNMKGRVGQDLTTSHDTSLIVERPNLAKTSSND